jgi:hypothetical protein
VTNETQVRTTIPTLEHLDRHGPGPTERAPHRSRHRWLGIALLCLGAGLIVNSLLGPLVFDAISYPWSSTMRNQAIGLETVSLVVVGPLCLLAGILELRGRSEAPVLALGPAAYAAYMFVQYVIGPGYRSYAAVVPFHVALFAFGAGTAIAAWNAVDRRSLPALGRRTEIRYAVLLLALATFIVARYLPALRGAIASEALPAEFRHDVAMYWSIVLLDLGIVVPATVAAAIGLIRSRPWRGIALFATMGWFALVPPSVAAMAIAMLANDDPNASMGQAVALTIVAIVFATFSIGLFLRLGRAGRVSTVTDGGDVVTATSVAR